MGGMGVTGFELGCALVTGKTVPVNRRARHRQPGKPYRFGLLLA